MAPYLAEAASQGQPPHTPPEVIRVHCEGLNSPPGGSSPGGASPAGGASPGGSSSSLSPASTSPAPPSPPPLTQEAEQDGTPCQVPPEQAPVGEVMYFSYPAPPYYPYPPVGAFLQYPGGLPPVMHYHPAHHSPGHATAQSPGYSPLPPPQCMHQCQVVYSQGYPLPGLMPSECLSSPTQQNPSAPPLQSPGYVTLSPPHNMPHGQGQVVYSQGYPVLPRECISSPIQQDPSVLEVGPSSSPSVSQTTTSGVVTPVSEPAHIPPPGSTLHAEPHHPQPHLQPTEPCMPPNCPADHHHMPPNCPAEHYHMPPNCPADHHYMLPNCPSEHHHMPPTCPADHHHMPPNCPADHPYMPPTCPDQQPPAMAPPAAMVASTHPRHAAMVYAPTASQQPYMVHSGPGGGVPLYTVATMHPPMGATGGEGTCVQVVNSYPLPTPTQAKSDTATTQYNPPPGHPPYPVAPPCGMDMTPPPGGSKWKAIPTISQNMELVWHGEFNSRFLTFGPHRWYLIPVEKPPGETAATLWPSDLYLPNVPWRTFRDSAKVRFCCDSCGNGWTSMKGRVIFWFYQDPKDMQGYVLFKLYGQQCKRCANGQFEHAMWYPDEVVKVIENLYNRIGQVYYSFYRPPIRIERRSGKPREQHNAELCQACKEGLCQEELMFT